MPMVTYVTLAPWLFPTVRGEVVLSSEAIPTGTATSLDRSEGVLNCLVRPNSSCAPRGASEVPTRGRGRTGFRFRFAMNAVVAM